MSFDFLQDMRRPDSRTAPLQPLLQYYAHEFFQGRDRNAKDYFSFIKKDSVACLNNSCRLLGNFKLDTPMDTDIAELPVNTWVLHLSFKLASPYIAKDDVVFSPTENPMRLEKIFGLPYVSPASWKGLLRGELHGIEENILERLFGTDPTEDDENSEKAQGRLCFFPTFFSKIGLDMINPHKRETKTDAHGPIKFEVVPANCTGQLKLAYIPFGANCDLETSLFDLRTIASGLGELLLNSGISAKRNIGYGFVKNKLEKDSYFQINNGDLHSEPEPETDPKGTGVPESLLQDTGEIIPYEEFCELYSKAQCQNEFGKKDRKKVYKSLSASITPPVEKQDEDEHQLQKFFVTCFEELEDLIAKLREA